MSRSHSPLKGDDFIYDSEEDVAADFNNIISTVTTMRDKYSQALLLSQKLDRAYSIQKEETDRLVKKHREETARLVKDHREKRARLVKDHKEELNRLDRDQKTEQASYKRLETTAKSNSTRLQTVRREKKLLQQRNGELRKRLNECRNSGCDICSHSIEEVMGQEDSVVNEVDEHALDLSQGPAEKENVESCNKDGS